MEEKQPDDESSDSMTDVVSYELESLRGFWKDDEGNTYDVCTNDYVKVTTTRPEGESQVSTGTSETISWSVIGQKILPNTSIKSKQTNSIRPPWYED